MIERKLKPSDIIDIDYGKCFENLTMRYIKKNKNVKMRNWVTGLKIPSNDVGFLEFLMIILKVHDLNYF